MPSMVRMRVGAAMPATVRKSLGYKTRMMRALADGEEFEVQASDARMMRVTRWASEVPAEVYEPALRRRGRPPMVRAPAPEPEPEPEPEPTVAELRKIAEEKGIELPSGYVRKDELLERLAEAEEDEPLG